MRPTILVLLFTFALATPLLACSSSEDKFCDKMRELYGDRMDDCETDALPEVKAQCKDPDAVFDCVADASSKDQADKCYEEKCERK